MFLGELMPAMCMRSLQRLEESLGFPATGVIDG